MKTLAAIDWEILNATSDDWENLEQIQTLIGHGTDDPGGKSRNGDSIHLEQICDAIRRLVEDGLLAGRLEDGTEASASADLSYVWHAWFDVTPKGKEAWSENGESP